MILTEKNYSESSRKKIIKQFILYILLFSFSNVFAQNTDTVELNAIVVKSDYFRKNINNLDSSILKINKSNTIAELLQNYSAFSIKNSGANGISTISFRGTSPSHTQLFWNNIPLNSPLLGQADLTSVPVFVTDKIKIQSGIETLENTTGALGGAIFLETISDIKSEINFNYNYNTLNNNSLSFNASYVGQKIFTKTGLFYSFGKNSFSYINTALPYSPIDTISNADFKNISFIQQVNYNFSTSIKSKIYLWWNYFYKNLPPLISYEGLFRTENQTGNDIKAGIEIDKNGKLFSLQNNTSFVHNFGSYYLADSIISFPQNEIFTKNDNSTSEISFYNYLKMKLIINKMKFILTDRFQYNIVSTYDSAQYAMTGFNKYYIINSANLVAIYNLGKKLQATATISSSVDSRKFYLPAFSFSVCNKKDLFWKYNLGRNIHLPSINDLYWQPGGNPYLKPEIAYSTDFTSGYSYSKNKVDLTVKSTLFISKIFDWILWKPTEYYYWTPVNIKSVLSKGIELNAELKIKNKIQHKILVNYSYTSSINLKSTVPNDNSVGKQLIYIPKNSANISYFGHINNLSFSTNFKFTDKRYTSTNNYNSFILPAYIHTSVSFSYKTIIYKNYKFVFTLNINNIFNKNYQSVLFRAMPRRYYSFSIAMRIF